MTALPLDEIACCDALTYLAGLPSASVDCVITAVDKSYIHGIIILSTDKEFAMLPINDLQAGKAGEYLVCADLILKGYVAFPSEQGLSYDVVVDYSGRLLRVQVKTTRQHKAMPQRKEYTPAYLFNIRKMGKLGRGSYTSEDIDIFACVALDTKTIGYIHESKASQTMTFRIREHEGKYFDERMRQRRTAIVELRTQGLSFRDIGAALELDASYVHRVYQGVDQDNEVGSYLDSLSFEDALIPITSL